MLTNKLAGLLATLAFLLLTLTWCLRTAFGMSTMDPDTVLMIGLLVIILYYFIIGRAIAWIGVRLVQERIAEIRADEEAKRHQARLRQQEIAKEKAKLETTVNKDTIAGVMGKPPSLASKGGEEK